MIVDSSALLAILNREPDAKRYKAAILIAAPCRTDFPAAVPPLPGISGT